eukprot:scaffold46197_cov27-Prasinocladus_malaysianus.AAC.1
MRLAMLYGYGHTLSETRDLCYFAISMSQILTSIMGENDQTLFSRHAYFSCCLGKASVETAIPFGHVPAPYEGSLTILIWLRAKSTRLLLCKQL